MRALRGNGLLWHRTSIESLDQILRHGAIEPNDGRFATTYAQSSGSYGKYIGAVCLFDFDTESLQEILDQAFNWSQFLKDRGPLTIMIGIDRGRLNRDDLILAGDAKHPHYPECPTIPVVDGLFAADGTPLRVPMYIPRVEAWHKGAIRISCCCEYLAIRRDADHYERIAVGADAMKEIRKFDHEWRLASRAQPMPTKDRLEPP